MTSGAPPLAPSRTTRRDFLAPAVRRAVASLRLPAGAWVLDAGTGSGGALPALARAVGAAGTVRAVDIDPDVLAPAQDYAARHGIAARVSVEYADLLDVVERAAIDPGGGFDAVWVGGAVRPENFAHPDLAVAAMARALRPGGVLALFCRQGDQAMFLPGHARLERLVRAASQLHHRGVGDGHRHGVCYLHWLQAAGLEKVTLDVVPRVGLGTDGDPTIRTHLETTVWPAMLGSALAHGPQAGMIDADIDELRSLITPGGPRYVLEDPAYYVLQPTILAVGRRGPAGRR